MAKIKTRQAVTIWFCNAENQVAFLPGLSHKWSTGHCLCWQSCKPLLRGFRYTRTKAPKYVTREKAKVTRAKAKGSKEKENTTKEEKPLKGERPLWHVQQTQWTRREPCTNLSGQKKKTI